MWGISQQLATDWQLFGRNGNSILAGKAGDRNK
jgi:hypothetical protein